MAVNLTALSTLTTGIRSASNLLLVNPQNDVGIQAQQDTSQSFLGGLANSLMSDRSGGLLGGQDPKFLFNYEGENVVMLESDITDHFVEDNTSLQDQIALKPETITTHGFIGELTDIAPKLLAPVKYAADKLLTVSAYTPALSATALLAYNEALYAYQVAAAIGSTAAAAWNSLSGGGSQNKQQVAFTTFYQYWKGRRLFTVQTPWAVFKNMAIRTLRAIQDPETRVITDFEITFKTVNIASTSILGAGAGVLNGQGRFNNQSAGVTDNGIGALGPSTPQVMTV
jgi:hypothetical protein